MNTQWPPEFKALDRALQHVSDIALAAKQGKVIQAVFTSTGDTLVWKDVASLEDLSRRPHCFRIKPEPREWWEVRDVSSCRVLYANVLFELVKAWAMKHAVEEVKLFKVTEVIE